MYCRWQSLEISNNHKKKRSLKYGSRNWQDFVSVAKLQQKYIFILFFAKIHTVFITTNENKNQICTAKAWHSVYREETSSQLNYRHWHVPVRWWLIGQRLEHPVHKHTHHTSSHYQFRQFLKRTTDVQHKMLHNSCPCRYSQMCNVSLHYLQNWDNYTAFSHGNRAVVRISKVVSSTLFNTAHTPELSRDKCTECLPSRALSNCV